MNRISGKIFKLAGQVQRYSTRIVKPKPPTKTVLTPQSFPPFSWVERGAITPVKNQGDNPTCWAHTPVDALEPMHFIATNRLLEFSPGFIVDRAEKSEEGHPIEMGIQLAKDYGGLPLLKDYPTPMGFKYKAAKLVPLGIKRVEHLHARNPVHMVKALERQPIAVGFRMFQEFDEYGDDIIRSYTKYPRKHERNVGHGGVIVGHGYDGKRHFYIVKNCWGTEWGDEGYFKIFSELEVFDEAFIPICSKFIRS